MITFNQIYTKIRTAVIGVASGAYVSATYTPTPSKFPAVFVREVGRFTPTRYLTMANSQKVQEETIEVQIYSNKATGAKTQADSILSAVETALGNAYFYEISAAPIDNEDPSVYRIAARFRRIIADADTI